MPYNQTTINNVDLSVAILLDSGSMSKPAITTLFNRHFDAWTEQFAPLIATQLVDDPDGASKAQLNEFIELASDATGTVSFAVNYYLTFQDSTIAEDWIKAQLDNCLKQLKQCFFQQFGKPSCAPPPFDPSSHDDDLSQFGFGGLLTEPLPAHLAAAI